MPDERTDTHIAVWAEGYEMPIAAMVIYNSPIESVGDVSSVVGGLTDYLRNALGIAISMGGVTKARVEITVRRGYV